MEKEEHIKIHKDLHKGLDVLIADFIQHNKDKLPSRTTLMELMKWSNKQTTNPEE